MNHKNIKWLANYLCTDVKKTEEFFNDETAISFFIIWTIFETELFDKNCGKKSIKAYADESKDNYDMLAIEPIVVYFHKRYADKKKYNNLKHKDIWGEIDIILESDYDKISPSQKILLAVYVVYRYRNNIFHGNKGIKSWSQYKEPIDKCIDVMIKLLNQQFSSETKGDTDCLS